MFFGLKEEGALITGNLRALNSDKVSAKTLLDISHTSAFFGSSWVYCKTDRYLTSRYLCFTKFGIFDVDLAFTKNCST